MIEPMKAKLSLKAAELQDGDIVCFQKAPDKRGSEPKSSESDQESISHLANQLAITDSDDRSTLSKVSHSQLDHIDDARVFYDFLLHRRVVKFVPHPRTATPDQEPFTLALSSKHSYDQIATKVGEKLNIDPTHIRFWTVNATSGNAKGAVKRGQSQNLQNILNPPYSTFSNNNQRSDALYFEILDMSLSELDTKKVLKIIWLSEGITKEVRRLLSRLVHPNHSVGDIRSPCTEEWHRR
jgi:ubiquitin carboxyl-terminal hydrolase 7